MAAVLLLSTACTKGPGKLNSQVVAQVNGEEVSVHQLELLLQREPVQEGRTDAATNRTLESLVAQTLAAQAARKEELDHDPRVIQLMELAKREVLARTYQDRLSEGAAEPSSDEIDRYFDAHPALFGQRKLFLLQETIVSAPAQRLGPLKARMLGAPSAEKLLDILRGEGLAFSARYLTLSAEDVPLALLDQLAAAHDKQTLVLPYESGARLLTLIQSQLAPLTRLAARKQISAYMLNERRRQAVQQGMHSLRSQAKVEYLGRFAALGVAAGDAPASAPTMK